MDSSLFLYAVREQELGIGDLRLLHATQVAMLDGGAPLSPRPLYWLWLLPAPWSPWSLRPLGV